MVLMERKRIDDALRNKLEDFARIEHERWSHWQKYMHSKGTRQPDGSLLIPADLVERWDRQLSMRYENLSDKEKDSDRQQVLKYFSQIVDAIASELKAQ